MKNRTRKHISEAKVVSFVILFLIIPLSFFSNTKNLKKWNNSSIQTKSIDVLSSNLTNDAVTSRAVIISQEINEETVANETDTTQEVTTPTPTAIPTHSPSKANTDLELCAPTNPSDVPQRLKAGEFRSETAYPYVSKDIWAELVDNKRTFFLRRYEDGFPNMTNLEEWIIARPHPITLVMNNYMDRSFPAWSIEEENFTNELESVLNQTNLHALYVENLEHLPEKTTHYKLKPLPKGLRWNFRNVWLFGESKTQQKEFYTSISSSPAETKKLFELNRTEAVWVSPVPLNNDVTQDSNDLNLTFHS